MDFTAVADQCAASLGWTTANEINIDHFEVEQSNNNINYQTTGSIPAKNETGSVTYFMKVNQHLNINYYRLKIIYSAVKEVKNNCVADDSYFSVYPNPVRNSQINLSLKTNKTGVATIWLCNAAGQRVLNNNILITAGRNNLSLGIPKLPGGVYILHLQSADGNRIGQPEKFIIE